MTVSANKTIHTIGKGVLLKVITEIFKLTSDTVDILKKCDEFDFDIFKLRELTNGRELETVATFILAKRDCFAKTDIDINKMVNFLTAVSTGYKNVTYHNKTHGADLC